MRARSFAAMIVLCATGAAAAAGAQQPTPPTAAKSTATQRESVGLTIYNQNFGLVREVRNLDLAQGRVALEFRDVASQIQPETVSIKALGGGPLRVLEQNYRFDLLSPQKLLEKYVGKMVRVYRYNDKTGKEDGFDAEVLSVADGPVLKINGEITFNFPGRFAFPELPANLIAKPTLVWMLDSQAAKQKVEVTYLTRGMTWSADYVFVVNADDDLGDITGWVTLNNQSGTSYQNASLKLVAGDVQRVSDYAAPGGGAYPAAPAATASAAPQFHEEGLFEYHLYTLERPTDVLDNEQKQVTLLEAKDVKVQKKLIFYGASYYFRGNYGQVVSNQKVGVYLDIENKDTNHMGMPLPKGIVRVYKADKTGAKQFIGEDSIDHTPRDEKIRIKMGDAFDVVGDRKQTDYKVLGSCSSESAWEISLRNHKDAAADVELYEPVGWDWEIVSSSLPATKKDAHTLTFNAHIAARGEVKVTYRIRVRYC